MSDYDSLIKLRSKLIQKYDIINKKGIYKNRYKFLCDKTINKYTATTKSFNYTKFTLTFTRIIFLLPILILINPFVARYIDKIDKTNYYLNNLTNEKLLISIGIFVVLSMFSFIPIFNKADKYSVYNPTKVYFRTCVYYISYVLYFLVAIFIFSLIAFAIKLIGLYFHDLLFLLIVWTILYYLFQQIFFFPALGIISILLRINKSNYLLGLYEEKDKDQNEVKDLLHYLKTLEEECKIVASDIANNDIVPNSLKQLCIIQKLVLYFEQNRVTSLIDAINLYCVENKKDMRLNDYLNEQAARTLL